MTTTTKNTTCPFCGSADLNEFESWLGHDDDYLPATMVECRTCKSQGLKRWWNQRSPMAEVKEIMESVKK